jgi:hypothetical protein
LQVFVTAKDFVPDGTEGPLEIQNMRDVCRNVSSLFTAIKWSSDRREPPKPLPQHRSICYRLRHLDEPDSPQRVALAEWVATHPQPRREATVYPIDDGYSWHGGVAVARSGNPGPDTDDC